MHPQLLDLKLIFGGAFFMTNFSSEALASFKARCNI